MEDSNQFPITKLKSLGFKAFLICMAIITLFPVFSAIIGLNGMFLAKAPKWFFLISIFISIVSLLSLFFIYQFKKKAVYTLITSIIAQFLWYLFAYGIEFHDVTFAIFVFIGWGLFQIIPRWKYFK